MANSRKTKQAKPVPKTKKPDEKKQAEKNKPAKPRVKKTELAADRQSAEYPQPYTVKNPLV